MLHKKNKRMRFWLRWYIIAPLILDFAIFFLCDLYLEFHGVPNFLRLNILAKLSTKTTTVSADWVKAGIFRGIVIEGCKIASEFPTGLLNITADEVCVSMSLQDLIQSQPGVTSIEIRNGAARFFTQAGLPVAEVTKLRMNGHITGDERLNANIGFNVHGITFSCNANIQNGSHIISLLSPHISQSSDVDLDALIAKWVKIQKQIEFGYADSFIDLQISCDALNPKDFRVAGSFGMSQFLLYHYLINKLSGNFAINAKGATIYNLSTLLNSNEQVTGSITVSFPENSITCDISGTMIPSNLLYLCPNALPSSATSILADMLLPVDFHLTGQTDYFFTSPELSITAKFNRLPIQNISLFRGTMEASMKQHVFSIDSLQAYFSYSDKDPIKANFKWFPSDNTIEGALSANINVNRLLQELKLIQYSSVAFNNLKSVQVDLTLYPSHPALNDLHVTAVVKQQFCKIETLQLENVEIRSSLEHSLFSIDSLSAKLAGSSRNASFDASCAISLAKLFDNSYLEMPFMTVLAQDNTPICTLSGKVLADLHKKTVGLDSCTLDLNFQDSYQTVIQELDIPSDSIPDAIFTHGAPGHITFNMPDVQWRNFLHEWEINGRVDTTDGEFNGMLFDTLGGNFKITPSHLIFTDLCATRPCGSHFSLNIDYDYSNSSVELTEIDYYGNPADMSAFILVQSCANFYRSLWEDTVWSKEKPPHLFTHKLTYTNSPTTYSLTAEIPFDVQDALYQKLNISSMSGLLKLDLPHRLDIVQSDISTLLGDFNLDVSVIFGSVSKCLFKLSNNADNRLNPAELLKAAGAKWFTLKDTFDISGQTTFNCDGEFTFLDSISDFKLSGNLQTERIDWEDIIILDTISADWNCSQDSLNISIHNANLLSGNIKANLNYNNAKKCGETIVNARNLSLDECHYTAQKIFNRIESSKDNKGNNKLDNSEDSNISSKTEKETLEESSPSDIPVVARENKQKLKIPGGNGLLKGIINIDSHLNFYQDWGASPLYLEGNGHMAIRNADLWRVPLMTSLGSMISWSSFRFFAKDAISSLGLISELDADFELRNNRIQVPKVYTNGNIIALNGKGEYSIDTNQLHFIVNRELMKELNLVSLFFKPLNWTFDAELTGPPSAPQWHIRTAIQKLFSN